MTPRAPACLAITPFDALAAASYGHVRASLEAAGTPIGPLDEPAAHVPGTISSVDSGTESISRS